MLNTKINYYIGRNYTITDDITKATHWLSKPDNRSCIKDYIVPNKMYKLIKLKDEETDEDEYFIISEDNNYSMYYMIHHGNFIIEEK